jgi:hypothetical protein
MADIPTSIVPQTYDDKTPTDLITATGATAPVRPVAEEPGDMCFHVDLAEVALQRDEEYAFRDWMYLVRAGRGQGHCRLKDVRAFLRELGFGRTAIQDIVQRLLSSGLATLCQTKRGQHDVLRPLTVRQLIDRYGLSASRWRVRIPLHELKARGLRGLLFGYVQAGRGDRPIARATLCQQTDVSKPTQRRGERRAGIAVTPNFIRVDPSTVDRMPCVAEEHEGQRVFRQDGSVFIQTANSYQHPTLTRSKRVVLGTRTSWHCRDSRAWQQTNNRQRYFTDGKRAARAKEWRVHTADGWQRAPVLVAEP